MTDPGAVGGFRNLSEDSDLSGECGNGSNEDSPTGSAREERLARRLRTIDTVSPESSVDLSHVNCHSVPLDDIALSERHLRDHTVSEYPMVPAGAGGGFVEAPSQRSRAFPKASFSKFVEVSEECFEPNSSLTVCRSMPSANSDFTAYRLSPAVAHPVRRTDAIEVYASGISPPCPVVTSKPCTPTANSSPCFQNGLSRVTLCVDSSRFVVNPQMFIREPDTMLGR